MNKQILERLRKEFAFVGDEKISGHTAMKIINDVIEEHLGLAIKSWIKENAESNQEQATQTNEEPTINLDLVIQREPEMIKENKNVPETKQSNMIAERNILISMIRRFF